MPLLASYAGNSRATCRHMAELGDSIQRWADVDVGETIGVRDPVRGGHLITKAEITRITPLLKRRFEACRLPPTYDGYILTGKLFCGLPKYRAVLGTGCNENKHGLAPEYVVGDNVGKAAGTALLQNGFAASNAGARRQRGFEVRFY